jgi:uncharacterized caspase-like protein
MRLLALIFALVILTAPAAHAEKRVALVIGNAAYKNAATLQNPRNDAQDVSAALQRLGFETIVGLDLNKDGMEEKSIAFARTARDADVALVYYSGHAMQFGGINYLMPVDAALHDEADLRRLTRVDEIVADLKQAKNLRILVLDACRDNPLAEELSRSIEASRGLTVDRGLARIIPPSGMIISYATQAGRTAADGRGRNSPYTMAFLKNIETPEEIGVVFRNVTSDVYTSTESKQLPELSLSLIGNFYLKSRPEPQISQPAPGPSEAERAWALTQNTTSQAVLEDFVRQFSNTPYGSMARARLDELKKIQAVAVAQPIAPMAAQASSSSEPSSGGTSSTSVSARPDATEQSAQQVAVVTPPSAPVNGSNDDSPAVEGCIPDTFLDDKATIKACTKAIDSNQYRGKALAALYKARGYAFQGVLYESRGHAPMENDSFRAAIRDYDMAIKLDPDNGWYVWGRACTKRLKGDKRGAAEDLRRAKALGATLEGTDGYPCGL